MGKRKPDQRQPRVVIAGEVLRQIRQHARSNSKTEVCGVLIGEEANGDASITARIPGLNAAQAGTYVTFTQDTWEHIYKIKDQDYPEARIVGWYHSHPGFGVFLSDHDTFIHKNFFSSALQVAWVYDPHSDEEGCFGWNGERLERLEEIRVTDDKGGEEAGETGKPEPVGGVDEEDWPERELRSSEVGPPEWLKWTLTALSHVVLAGLAIVATWMFFPRYIYILVDVIRGVAMQAPPGTHLDSDGKLVVPGLSDRLRSTQPDFSSPIQSQPAPATSQSQPAPATSQSQTAPKNDGGKDHNAPRK